MARADCRGNRGFDLTHLPCRRSRLVSALLFAVTVALGLGSRRFSTLLPPLLHKNAGDILYATMIFWLLGVCFPTSSGQRLCAGAFLACAAVEFAKLIQAPWLAGLRHTQAGALALGTGFHISNLVCYALGAGLGLAIERLLLSRAQSIRTDAPA